LIIGELLEEYEHILMWFVGVLPTERGVVKEESCAQWSSWAVCGSV